MMKSCSFSSVLLYFLTYLIEATTPSLAQLPNEFNANSNADDHDGTSTARISVSGDPVDITIPSDGSLVYHQFNYPNLVEYAWVISSERDTTCFFWMTHEDRAMMMDNFRDVSATSESFSSGQHLRVGFPFATRLYCYDSTAEKASDDTFTIFTENGDGMIDLVRVRARQNVASTAPAEPHGRKTERQGRKKEKMQSLRAVLDLRESHPQLRTNAVAVSLIRAPTAPRVYFWNSGFARIFCTVLWQASEGARFTIEKKLVFREPRDLLRFTCYRATTSEEANGNWANTEWMTKPSTLD